MVRRNRTTGFTLFELLVVLVLIALITSLVGPRLINPLNRRNIESTARQIAAILRYARSGAVTEKVPYRAIFNMDTDQLAIEQYRTEEEAPSNLATNPELESGIYNFAPGIRLDKGILLDGQTVDAGVFEMMFFPMGGTSGGEVILSDKENRRFSIAVDMITGSVTVKKEGLADG